MPTELPVETDERFPSGPWTGFFLQPMISKSRHWMELRLTFSGGVMKGEGRDWVGEFIIRGRYEVENGQCRFTKRYVGKHDVSYRGYNEGRGIWGVWSLKDPPWRGGFHIWPEGMGDPSGGHLAEAIDAPADAGEAETAPEPELETAGAGAQE